MGDRTEGHRAEPGPGEAAAPDLGPLHPGWSDRVLVPVRARRALRPVERRGPGLSSRRGRRRRRGRGTGGHAVRHERGGLRGVARRARGPTLDQPRRCGWAPCHRRPHGHVALARRGGRRRGARSRDDPGGCAPHRSPIRAGGECGFDRRVHAAERRPVRPDHRRGGRIGIGSGHARRRHGAGRRIVDRGHPRCARAGRR